MTYISTERPYVTYVNPKYMSHARLTSHRYSRKNPVYYVNLHFNFKTTINNSYLLDFYIYEWLTNQYKRSSVEFHYKFCNLIERDTFFGSAMRQGKLLKPCPYPPGEYNLVNMTVNPVAIPSSFPFTRGRIYMNWTHGKTKDRVAEGHIDMNLVQINKKFVKESFKYLNNPIIRQ